MIDHRKAHGRHHTRAKCAPLVLGALLVGVPSLWAAELSVSDVAVRPGHTSTVVVSGSIHGESTFGLTVLVELVPRSGSVGRVMFTPQKATRFALAEVYVTEESRFERASLIAFDPEVSHGDIDRLGDAWPEMGSFTAFDTVRSGDLSLNGFVDDNGTFLSDATRFSGPLASLPVVAASDAEGVWDVRLSTRAGDSRWEGVATTLVAGTITVTPGACAADAECDDGESQTSDRCLAGICRNDVIGRKFEAHGAEGAGRGARRDSSVQQVDE